MKLFTWCADARDYFDHPNEKEDREKILAEVNEEMPKLMAGDFEGCKVEDLMHDLAYLRMEKELFEAGQMIIDHWPWENKDFAIGEFAYQYYGIFCYIKKRYKEAEEWFLKIIGDHEGYDMTFYSWLACIYAETGQHDKAIAKIEAIKKQDMESEKPIYFHAFDFGRYYLSIDMYEAALTEFDIFQADRSVLDSNFYLEKSSCLRELKRNDEAREFLEEGYKKWQNDEEIEAHLAIMLFEDLHDSERALSLLLKSFGNTKGFEHESWRIWNSNVAGHISKIYAEKADWENAYAYMREIVNWSDKLLNKEALLDMIENRPKGEDDDQAMIYVTLFNFIYSVFAAMPDQEETTEENPYLIDTENKEALQDLTDWDSISQN